MDEQWALEASQLELELIEHSLMLQPETPLRGTILAKVRPETPLRGTILAKVRRALKTAAEWDQPAETIPSTPSRGELPE
jgi:hypothetical protein